MPEPAPIDLLKDRLKEFERSLEKSVELYNTQRIDAETHLEHKENLRKHITAYSQAIKILQTCEQ